MQGQVCPRALLKRPGCIQLAEPYLLHGASEQVDQLVIRSIACLLDCQVEGGLRSFFKSGLC
ncbi:MAG: hypothetical protein ACK5PF_06300, partial [bacterium]